MFATVNRTTRIAGLSFAVLMAVIANGAMLIQFDGVATDALVAHSLQTGRVAVLGTVTIVGHRS